MTGCYLTLSIAANGARDSLADLLRDYRLPDRPLMVKKDGERVRAYWRVEASDHLVESPPQYIVPGYMRAVGARSAGEYAGYSIAPVVFNLFRDSAFDARWNLKKDNG